MPLDRPEATEQWRELVAAGDASIRALSVVGQHLVLSELADGCSQLRICRLDGTGEAIVPTPGIGMITTSGQAAPSVGVPTIDISTGHDEFTFLFSSPATPHIPFRYDLHSGTLERIAPVAEDLAVTTTLVHATSRDGTTVPCYLTHLATLDRQRPQPTLLLAYGAWNLPNSPRYTLASAAFALSGGIVAHPILRGGGEYGSSWWQQGRRHHKQNTFDDLFAVAEHLIAAQVTDSHLLGLQGGSAGGLTAGAAVTQRPELFGTVVITAPVLDLLRYAAVPGGSTTTAIEELGDPDDPRDSEILAAYSPYHHVYRTEYPPILVVAAEYDVRTPPWHSRKFVARLQSVNTSGPAMLRLWKSMGHGTGATATTERTAEWLGFMMRHLGVAPGMLAADATSDQSSPAP